MNQRPGASTTARAAGLPDRRAVREGRPFIDRAAASGQPFMLEVATFAPHAPYTPGAALRARGARGLPTRAPRPTTGCPTDPPPWLTRPPAADAADQRRRSTALPQAGRSRPLRRRHDRPARERAAGQGRGREHVPRVQLRQRLPHGRVPAVPGQADRLRHRHPRAADRHRPRRPRRAMSSASWRPTSTWPRRSRPSPACPCPPPIDGHSLRRCGTADAGALAAGHPRRASRPGHTADPDRQTCGRDPPTYEASAPSTALYVRYADGAQEYYDTASDPFELRNLAGGQARRARVLVTTLAALATCRGSAACQAASRLP